MPAAQASAWFPAGSELRGLARSDFERLVRDARAGYQRQLAHTEPRLIRARHSARWDAGVLLGHSEFIVDARAEEPSLLPLEPWTPAVSRSQRAPAAMVNLPDGRCALVVEPGQGPTTLSIAWELRPLGGKDGHVFSLGLPRLAASTLILDLPADRVPEGPSGLRLGPSPGSGPERRTWQFTGPGGPIDLRLRARGESQRSGPGHGLWVGGTTRILVDSAGAHWEARWQVDRAAPGPHELSLKLEGGLEPLDVAGPGVISFQTTEQNLAIRLSEDAGGPAEITVRGIASAPAEGAWTIPAAVPANAYFTGDRTIVHVDESRVVADCRNRAGRRVSPRTDEDSEPPPFVFEAERAGPVADMVFRKPGVEATAQVRGLLHLGSQSPRFEAQLLWKVERGRLLALAADLPPQWVADRVQVAGSTEPVTWNAEPRRNGGTRVRVSLPTALEAGRSVTLVLTASAPELGTTGQLGLPRVRPVGTRVADELWAAQVEPGWTARPTQASGLAWIDPLLVVAEPVRPFASFLGLAGNLAWRFTAPDGQAQVDRAPVTVEPRAAAQCLAMVDADRLVCDWVLTLELPAAMPRSVVMTSSAGLDAAPQWRLADSEAGSPLPSRALDASERAARGLPSDRSAWQMELPATRLPQLRLHWRLETPWSGQGSIPLINLPPPFKSRGTVVIFTERDMRSEADAVHLRQLDPSAAWHEVLSDGRPKIDSEPRPNLATHRRAYAFGYDSEPDALRLRTQILKPGPVEGVIEEAVLSSHAAFAGASRHQLILRVAPTSARSLALTLPAAAALERALLNGSPVVPTEQRGKVILPFGVSTPEQPRAILEVDYRTPAIEPASAAVMGPDLPEFSLPCMSFCWQLEVPPPWEVEGASVGLRALAGAAAGDARSAEPWQWPGWAARFSGAR
ncbi:MAG TPA: hypothetical protein VGY53_04200, partial [Isosphaeraceae bacterium]|nr:hypothetical protein [Isosphaeraceae bacterium]